VSRPPQQDDSAFCRIQPGAKVYDPARHGAAAYVCPNIDRPTCRTVSVSSLQQLTGLDVFPALPFDLKSTAMPLPAAEPYGARRHRPHRQSGTGMGLMPSG
jgi:hypothetical protein